MDAVASPADKQMTKQEKLGQMVAAAQEWFLEWQFALRASPRQDIRGGVVLGCPLWGEDYIDRFERYCVASLLTPENAAALAGSRLALFTDAASVNRVAGVERRFAGRMEVLIYRIPPELMDGLQWHENARYVILGTVNNIALQMAARWGMGFHMFMPDHIYCRDYFRKLLSLGTQYHAIVQAALTMDMETGASDLESLRGKHCAIDATPEALTEVAWRHLHPHVRSRFVDGSSRLPLSSWLAWRGEDRLVTMSPHHHPAWMSPHLCRYAPSRVPHTMDAELPQFMHFGFYPPQPTDGLTYIEVSSGDKPSVGDVVPFADWSAHTWEVMKFRDNYLPVLGTPIEIAIPAGDGMPLREIGQARAGLLEAHTAGKLAAMEAWAERVIDD